MDYQRKHPRFDVDTPAAVTILGAEDGPIAARVGDFSQSGLKLRLPVPITSGETLRIEIGEEVFVGVIRHIDPFGDAETEVGVELIHWIERDQLQHLLDEWTVKAF